MAAMIGGWILGGSLIGWPGAILGGLFGALVAWKSGPRVIYRREDPLDGCVRGATWKVRRDHLLYNGAPTLVIVSRREPNCEYVSLIPEDLYDLLEVVPK
jgi:hypothetical protein